jgi:hypothetical protein
MKESMSAATDSPPTRSTGVLLKRFVASTDGLQDAARIGPGERRHHSTMEGIVTGMKLIGPHPRNYRDWVLEGLFDLTDAATGERTQASRMYNRDRKFFVAIRDLLKAGKAVDFSYEFYVERRAVGGGLKARLEVTGLAALETSDLRMLLRSRQHFFTCVFDPVDSP